MFDPSRPYSFHIELTDKCNAGCPMCPRTDAMNFCKPDRSKVFNVELGLADFREHFTDEFCARTEEIVFGDPSTGASNDIQRATELSRNMVTKWGLSERLGPLTYSEEEGEVFLGHSVTQHKNVSDDTAHAIDEEIRSFIDRNYQRAEQILNDNLDKLHLMAEALIKYETIDTDQIDDIMDGRTPRPPRDWDDSQPGSGASASKSKEDGASDGAIGGPAGQH